MTDDFGELMRDAANAAAARSTRPPVADVRRRLARRRAGTTAGVAAVVALAVAASAGAWETKSSLRPVTPPTPSPSASPVASPTPTPLPTVSPPPPKRAVPATIVAGTPGGPIVVLSAETGRVVRTLAGTTGFPQLSPDGRTVYFSRDLSYCRSELVAVPARGGPATVLTTFDGMWEVSPDGNRVAYYEQNGLCTRPETFLVVKDLRAGTERRWSAGPGGEYGVPAIAWAPDSAHLAVVRDMPRPPDEVEPASGAAGYAWHTLWILDTRAKGTTLDAARRVPGIQGLYRGVRYRGPEGTLHILGVPSHGDLPSVLSEVDPETGRTKEVVVFPHPVYGFDFDASGRHLVYVWDDALYRWRGGRSVRIADGITVADW